MIKPTEMIIEAAHIRSQSDSDISLLAMAASVAAAPSPKPKSSNEFAKIWNSLTKVTKPFYMPTISTDGEIGKINTGIKDLDNSQLDLRVLSLEQGDMYADNDERVAYFRILSIDKNTGMINNGINSQIFPAPSGSDNINEKSGVAKYRKFILLSKSFGKTERAQIIKTNSSLQIYLTDSQYEIMNIQIALKKNWDDPWDTAMIVLWEQLMRATVLARKGQICEFGIQNHVYWGYPLSLQGQDNSNQQFLAIYNLSFLITDSSYDISSVDPYVLDAIGYNKSDAYNSGVTLEAEEFLVPTSVQLEALSQGSIQAETITGTMPVDDFAVSPVSYSITPNPNSFTPVTT